MTFLRVSMAAALVSAAAMTMSAQTKPPRPVGSGGTIGGTTNPPGANTPPGSTAPGSGIPIDPARVIMITGKIVIDNGQEPGQPVQIERICTGRPHPEGYSDPRGNFSIRLGQEQEIADASETPERSTVTAANPGGGVRESQLAMCDLRLVLAGYRSETIPLANRKYMDNPDVGTVVMHRLGTVEGLTLSATTALAPKESKKAYEHGVELMRKGKLGDAMREFQKAVTVYPKHAAAWFNLGLVQERANQMLEARNDYAQAIAADAKFVPPHIRLFLMAFHEKKWPELAQRSDHVIHLDPYDYPGAYYYNAVANLEMGKLGPAEKSAREALARDTTHQNPQTNYVLGIILAQKQQYAEAAQLVRAYLKAMPDAKNREEVNRQLESLDRMVAIATPPQLPGASGSMEKQDK